MHMYTLVNVSICEICLPRHPRSCLEVLWIFWVPILRSLFICQVGMTHRTNFFNSKDSRCHQQSTRSYLPIWLIFVQRFPINCDQSDALGLVAASSSCCNKMDLPPRHTNYFFLDLLLSTMSATLL